MGKTFKIPLFGPAKPLLAWRMGGFDEIKSPYHLAPQFSQQGMWHDLLSLITGTNKTVATTDDHSMKSNSSQLLRV